MLPFSLCFSSFAVSIFHTFQQFYHIVAHYSLVILFPNTISNLLLFQPFNFGLIMQTLDQKAADMTVDIALEPELRGELDPLKLARILKLIPVLSTTFSIGDCLTTVSASDIAVYGTDQPYVMPMLPMGDDSEVLSLADIVKRTIASTDTTVNKTIIVIDPMIVSMSVNIKIPEVALDLTYDPLRARHLVLAVRALEMQVLMRSRDMQVRSSFIFLLYH